MKRLIIIALVLLMLSGMAVMTSCRDDSSDDSVSATQPNTSQPDSTSPAEDDGEITQEMLENSKPCEYIPEKLEAGMEVYVACAMQDKNFFWELMCNGIRPEVEAIGCTWVESTSNNNVADLLQNIENFGTMGCALIIVNGPDSGSVQSAVETVQASGSMCLIYGEPADFTNVVRIDCYEAAWQQMAMAEAWIAEKYPDAETNPVHIAIMANSANATTKQKTDAYQDYAEQSPLMVESYFEDLVVDIDVGFTAAENALTTDSDIRVFINFDIGAANGVDNYLVSLISTGLNIDDYGIFTAGEDNNTRTKLSGDYTEPSAFRGTILDGETLYEAMVECSLGLLDGTYQTPFEFMQPIYTLTNFGYSYDSRLQ